MIERSDAVNWSTLKNILTSPRHYRHALSTPREDTDALLLGRLVHAMVYEPDAVSLRYVVQPNYHRGMNDDTARAKGYDGGKQAAAAWDEDSSGRDVVTADMHGRASAMRESIMADPVARAFVEGGEAERPIKWRDAATGIECRGRVDHINGRLSDLKSTARIAAFHRQAAALMYHGQIAYYSNGLEAVGYTPGNWPALIAVESVAPYDVVVLSVPPEALERGRSLCRKALDTLAECRLLDRWPGVGGGTVGTLSLPAYALVDDDEEPITMGGEAAF